MALNIAFLVFLFYLTLNTYASQLPAISNALTRNICLQKAKNELVELKSNFYFLTQANTSAISCVEHIWKKCSDDSSSFSPYDLLNCRLEEEPAVKFGHHRKRAIRPRRRRYMFYDSHSHEHHYSPSTEEVGHPPGHIPPGYIPPYPWPPYVPPPPQTTTRRTTPLPPFVIPPGIPIPGTPPPYFPTYAPPYGRSYVAVMHHHPLQRPRHYYIRRRRSAIVYYQPIPPQIPRPIYF